jgi:phenylpyruvate tautomerase PptA (4-oxalocrotonate tautomerase family)
MPLISLKTSVEVPENKREALLSELSKIVADSTGKPEQYVMAIIETADFMMGGHPSMAAFADIRGIGGINRETNAKISEKLCVLLENRLSISPQRVYINFTDIPASNWGCNGSTFG